MSTIGNVLPAISGNSVAFSAARQAMTELGVAGCVGMGCVRRNYLTPSMVGALSKTTFSILLPMFLGTSIVRTVTTYGLQRSSFAVPLMGVVQPFVLYLLASHVLLPLFGVDRDSEDGRSAAVCCAWGNTSVVPLIFCESLFRADLENLAKSYAQISLFLVGWSPFFWSYGRSVLLGESVADRGDDVSAGGGMKTLGSMKQLLSPPVVGIMLGLVVALSPLKYLFVGSSVRKAPLAVVYNTFQNFGRAASPLSLLVLTSSLALGAGGTKGDLVSAGTTKPPDDDDEVGFLRLLSCVSVARFLVSPILALGMLDVLLRAGIIKDWSADPMLWFILVMQSCMPSAQNLVLMLQVADKTSKAGQMAKFLFSVYATSMLPVVLILTWALQKFDLA